MQPGDTLLTPSTETAGVRGRESGKQWVVGGVYEREHMNSPAAHNVTQHRARRNYTYFVTRYILLMSGASLKWVINALSCLAPKARSSVMNNLCSYARICFSFISHPSEPKTFAENKNMQRAYDISGCESHTGKIHARPHTKKNTWYPQVTSLNIFLSIR